MKNAAIVRDLKSLNALSPNVSLKELPEDLLTGQSGIVNAYTIIIRLSIPEEMSCIYVLWNPVKLTNSSAHMKPTVPHTRIGGKAVTVSSPPLFYAVKAPEVGSPIVGMKKAV